jgi:phosphate uptake regulator
MVLSFFRRDDDGLGQVARTVTAMLADARHSFDLAMGALVAGADATLVVDEVRQTDLRINDAEQEVRRRLLVHAVATGTGDVEIVLGYLMLSRKIERIGDQAKNILDLALEGVDLSEDDDVVALRAGWSAVSDDFADALSFLEGRSEDEYLAFRRRCNEQLRTFEAELRQMIHSELPAARAVPRALLARYLKRIVANLLGIVTSLIDPFDQLQADGDGARTDLDD